MCDSSFNTFQNLIEIFIYSFAYKKRYIQEILIKSSDIKMKYEKSDHIEHSHDKIDKIPSSDYLIIYRILNIQSSL